MPDKNKTVSEPDLKRIIAGNIARELVKQGRGSSLQFAREIGMSMAYMHRVMKGNANISVGKLEQIANELGVEPWMLLYPGPQ